MSKKTTGLVASDGVIASVMVDNCWVLRNSSEVPISKREKKGWRRFDLPPFQFNLDVYTLL